MNTYELAGPLMTWQVPQCVRSAAQEPTLPSTVLAAYSVICCDCPLIVSDYAKDCGVYFVKDKWNVFNLRFLFLQQCIHTLKLLSWLTNILLDHRRFIGGMCTGSTTAGTCSLCLPGAYQTGSGQLS